MTRRERLMAVLRGEPVDRPPVSFYEVGGFAVDPSDPDPYNVYNSPSWRALLALAEERTDLIRMRAAAAKPRADHPAEEFYAFDVREEGRSRFTHTTLTVAGRALTAFSRRDAELNTGWTIEHLLKGPDDLDAYLQLPDELFERQMDVSNLVAEEQALGDRGIVMVETGDPLCMAADLFSMADYTVVALTEPRRFHRLLEKLAPPAHEQTEIVARDFPGHLWRICGPEYATEPYLPPRLFTEYVVRYTGPMVEAIQRHGGFARLHCHGRLKAVLPAIASMRPAGLDPIEPPPQGDVLLADVRREYGRDMVLFGNIEASEIENLAPEKFEGVVAASLRDGTAGEGRGFVLMPSACPCGRQITPRAMANYETMLRLAERF